MDGEGESIRRRFRRAIRLQMAAGRNCNALAAELHVKPSTMRNYANGSALPPIERWADFARVLGVPERFFLYGTTEEGDLKRLELFEDVAETTARLAELETVLEPVLRALEGRPLRREDQAALRVLAQALAPKR